MSNTIRIRTSPNGGDKYIKTLITQDFDFIEILSLKLTQEDVYRDFCSDYGVVVGRVIVNSGFGVPNAKVSVFIPIDEVDSQNPAIRGLYPYELVTDKNSEGVRYNLLPIENDSDNTCYTPIGTFPKKREVLDNETMLNLYCKYYKFTTTTNHAGDFMIFGVPVGTYTIHVDADISDIGIISQRPYDLIRQGTPAKLFDSPTKFKGGTNLDKLVQIKTANAGVNIQPFWGDLENCQIGISRVDVDLNYNISPAAIFMGSIYGDQEKHSINKRCRPRNKVGEMCEQVTGPGYINMIRKTENGDIEDFDIEGGQLIDEDGTWAYQVPMNLDYMVTDEEGNLIPSDDPNIGIPTRASVRFKIGMYETGGEGRLRTRAQYLVPNNPSSQAFIDYEFGEKTKSESFKDLYWNKIYTVSNFISRFQTAGGAKNRNIIGMKNVDNCSGDKTPFPYNRVNTDTNPIFFIICMIIKIIAFLIYVMNFFILPLINVVIGIINTVIGGIVAIINQIIGFLDSVSTILGGNSINEITFNEISKIGCLTVKCPSDEDPSYFAPGCKKNGGIDGGAAYANSSPSPDYYCGDPDNHACTLTEYAVGLDDCMAFQMAKTLGLYQFDFYNDWVNGTLYSFLLKYKKKRKGREKFCEYDCQDFVNDVNYSGVDGNDNGPDNNCHNNFLLDTCVCVDEDEKNCQFEKGESGTLREGLIKKYEGEFYYAATTHNTTFKLFATDVVCLGSVFNGDWQGIPKLQPLLTPSSYKLPPDIQEREDDGSTILASGMAQIDGTTQGLFFDVNCLGLHVNSSQCLNIRHICEMGVDIDESFEDPSTGIMVDANYNIGSDEISDINKELRDVFLVLNNGTTIPNFDINGVSSDFNIDNTPLYVFNSANDNDADYVSFRGYDSIISYSQPKHSFFMYFGILPGKTAIEKMNDRFFGECKTKQKSSLTMDVSTTATDSLGSATGSITFSFNGGLGSDYTYTVTGPNAYSYNGSTTLTLPIEILDSLEEGLYVITGFDAIGNTITTTVSVTGPAPLYCSVLVGLNVSTIGGLGELLISVVGGGEPIYTYTLSDSTGPLSTNVPATSNTIISNLPVGEYSVEILDSATPQNSCLTTGLTISGPSQINLTVANTGTTCYNGNNGALAISVTGGVGPFTLSTQGPNLYSAASTLSNLINGTYVTTIVDSLGTTAIVSTTINSIGPQMVALPRTTTELAKQCNSNNYDVSFIINSNGLVLVVGYAYVEYMIDNNGTWITSMPPVQVTSTSQVVHLPPITNLTSSVTIRYSNTPGGPCYSNTVTVNKSLMTLPTANLGGCYNTTTTNYNIYGGIGTVTPSIVSGSGVNAVRRLTDSVGCTFEPVPNC